MLRVGRHGIVAFPILAIGRLAFHTWSAEGRRQLTFFHTIGTSLPNLHFLTVHDFVQLCREQRWVIESQILLHGDRQVRRLANLLSEVAVFSIRSAGTPPF